MTSILFLKKWTKKNKLKQFLSVLGTSGQQWSHVGGEQCIGRLLLCHGARLFGKHTCIGIQNSEVYFMFIYVLIVTNPCLKSVEQRKYLLLLHFSLLSFLRVSPLHSRLSVYVFLSSFDMYNWKLLGFFFYASGVL